jgi:hypothetical protein
MKLRSLSARSSRRYATFAVAATVTIAGIAGASWSAQSNGTAKAQAGRLQPVSATPATPTAELFPGGSADAALTLTNPNPVAMTVSSIRGSGPITSDSAACDAAGNGVSFTDPAGAWEVANSASLVVNLADAVRMSVDSATECQGATFTIPVSVVASVSGQGGSGTSTTAAPTTTTTAPARFDWQPMSVTFPPTEVGATSAQSVQVLLRNVGATPGQVETGKLGSVDFPIEATTCTGATLAPNQTCSYTLRFRPTVPGQLSTTFEARAAGSGNWSVLMVGGQAMSPAQVDIQPSTWNFGSVPVGGESQPTTLTVRNLGQAPTQTLSVSVSDPAFVFRGGTCLGQSALAGNGSSCTVIVSFRPSSAGSRSGTLRVNYSTATQNKLATADLLGTGA